MAHPASGPDQQHRARRRSVWLATCLLAASIGAALADPPAAPGRAQEATMVDANQRPKPRPAGLGRVDLRCTADGAHCVALASYIPDICRTIEATAAEAGLDTGFFARLIWQESRFDSSAVSPAGAQGIAQFMPGTADLRGLGDAFNPAEALRASALYLAEMRDSYGNIGLAAAAYNAGEARLAGFRHRGQRLPPETRAYVPIITGHSANTWRDAPPDEWDLALDGDTPFQTACEKLARSREPTDFRAASNRPPWAIIVAAHRDRSIAELRHGRARQKSALLRGHEVEFYRMRLPAQHGRQWTAQIGAGARKQANSLCWELRKQGVGCIVLRND